MVPFRKGRPKMGKVCLAVQSVEPPVDTENGVAVETLLGPELIT